MHSPTNEHLQAVLRVFRYLKNALKQGLYFKESSDKTISVYIDVDWAGYKVDMRSTTGYRTYLWENLVTCRSKKQCIVYRSSAETELRAIALRLCEGFWLRMVLKDIGQRSELPIRVFCDNISAINIAENPVQHDKSKHVKIDILSNKRLKIKLSNLNILLLMIKRMTS